MGQCSDGLINPFEFVLYGHSRFQCIRTVPSSNLIQSFGVTLSGQDRLLNPVTGFRFLRPSGNRPGPEPKGPR